MTTDKNTALAKTLGYEFNNSSLLDKALTHRSYFNEKPEGLIGHNERLEFLGDAVLDLVVSEQLFALVPKLPEGQLSKIRASLVNESGLCEVAKKLNLGEYLMLGKGELQSSGREKPRLLSSVFEAVVGAIYVDGGFEPARAFILKYLDDEIQSKNGESGQLGDFKTQLQEITQKMHRKTPEYDLIAESGPDHNKVFKVRVSLNEKVLGEGEGKTKKMAEQSAASAALEIIEGKGK